MRVRNMHERVSFRRFDGSLNSLRVSTEVENKTEDHWKLGDSFPDFGETSYSFATSIFNLIKNLSFLVLFRKKCSLFHFVGIFLSEWRTFRAWF